MDPLLFATANTPKGTCKSLYREVRQQLRLYNCRRPGSQFPEATGSLWNTSQNVPALFKKQSQHIAECFIEEGKKRAKFCFYIGLCHVCPLPARAGRWEEEQVRTSSTARALSWERGVRGCQLGTALCGNMVPLAKTQLKRCQTSVPSLCEPKWKRTKYFSSHWDS